MEAGSCLKGAGVFEAYRVHMGAGRCVKGTMCSRELAAVFKAKSLCGIWQLCEQTKNMV